MTKTERFKSAINNSQIVKYNGEQFDKYFWCENRNDFYGGTECLSRVFFNSKDIEERMTFEGNCAMIDGNKIEFFDLIMRNI